MPIYKYPCVSNDKGELKKYQEAINAYKETIKIKPNFHVAYHGIGVAYNQIYNISNGNRFTTYAIRGKDNSGVISVNGAAAHKAQVGDLLIIASYASYSEVEVKNYAPTLCYVDANVL
jgi:aspartate 1-decarboxylase